MCKIISYGFTVNGNDVSGPACNAIISDILGARVSISIEASDVGRSLIADIAVRINGIFRGNYASPSYTPTYSPGMWTFIIPFTGLSTQIGTYTFGSDGCAFIHAPDYTSQYCYSCTTTRCTTLTVSTPPPVCSTPAVTLTIPS